MRRKVALFLAVLMVAAIFMPVQSLAQSGDELTRALTVAKTKFNIPEDLQFTYNVYSDNGRRVWYLNWTSKDKAGQSINVRVDEKGAIVGYDNYNSSDYANKQGNLPKISKKDAREIAEKFLKNVNPEIVSQLKYQDNGQNSLMDYNYYFSYVRVINGIPFYNNYVGISVNRDTGEVKNYYVVWNSDFKFPSPEKVITMEKAQDSYTKNMGLKLVYNYAYQDEKLRTYPVYIPKYNNSLFAIDAFTGDKIQMENLYYGYDREATMDQKMSLENTSGMGMRDISLSPEEIKAIDEVSKLITVNEAEKIARGEGALDLTGSYKLTDSGLSRAWPDNSQFFWHLNFVKEPSSKDETYMNVSCTINAVTKEIKSFYKSVPYTEGSKAVLDETASKAAVENFLKKFAPAKFSQTEYDENDNKLVPYYESKELPLRYNFVYTRKVNDITFPGNGLNIVFDAVNGKIISYDANWFNTDFPSIEKAISSEKANDKLFSEIGLELQYRSKYTNGYILRDTGSIRENPEILLVYSLNPGKPTNLDAYTGEILTYDGKPYKEYKPVEYTDIAGSFAQKQIALLAEYGVTLGGTQYKPDQNIVQKDFLILLSKTISTYYGPVITSDSSEEDIENLYSFMLRENIIKQDERNPNSSVTREEAVKYVIRALKYDKVADLNNIFKCSFKDADDINPDLIGYVAIANGLKIVNGSGGNFLPKNKLTRAEAAVIIYNYLQN